MGQLGFGELFGLDYESGPNSRHVVLVGRSPSGRLYLADSGRSSGECYVTGAELDRYLDRSGAVVFAQQIYRS